MVHASHTEAEKYCNLLIRPSRDAFSSSEGPFAAIISDIDPQQLRLANDQHSQVLSALIGLKQLLQSRVLELEDPRPSQEAQLPAGNSVLVEELSDGDTPEKAFDPVMILLASSCYIRTAHTEHAWSTESISEAAEGVLAQLEEVLKDQHPISECHSLC